MGPTCAARSSVAGKRFRRHFAGMWSPELKYGRRPFHVCIRGVVVAVCVGIARADAGAQSAQAIRIADAPRLDGRLTEPVWQTANAVTNLTQREPDEGAPAIDGTEVRFAYDDDALYIGARMFSRDPGSIRALGTRRVRRELVAGIHERSWRLAGHPSPAALVAPLFPTARRGSRRRGSVTPVAGRHDVRPGPQQAGGPALDVGPRSPAPVARLRA